MRAVLGLMQPSRSVAVVSADRVFARAAVPERGACLSVALKVVLASPLR